MLYKAVSLYEIFPKNEKFAPIRIMYISSHSAS